MTRVRVLYFAGARDAARVAEEACELPPSVVTVRDFARFIGERHPEIGARMTSLRIARNERFAEDDEPIADGDVLALIPPVAGG
jgi:molybdopterin converting factor subunit 1